MKEFEKWIKLQKYSSPNYFLGAEGSWEAALEWALKDLEKRYEQAADTWDVGWFGVTIEKELKNE